MRYVRFLKPPRVVDEKHPAKAHVSALVTITSDLGDSFLPCAVTLCAELHAADARDAPDATDATDAALVCKTVQWTSGMRSLPVTLPLHVGPGRASRAWPVRVRVGLASTSSSDDFQQLADDAGSRGLVSAWSAPVDPSKARREAVRLVERRFGRLGEARVCVWEETGESIARHLWDAGITMACHITGLLEKAIPECSSARNLHVVELGTGCGIVGISIAQAVKNAKVILTDLPEAQEIVERNISCATPAQGSTLRFLELDWESELPDLETTPASDDRFQTGLVVAADCTYNSDSSPALVNTLRRLANSPHVVVLIAMKKRHSSEDIFFELMSESGFTTESATSIPLPGDEECGEETVYIYMYRRRG